MNAMEVVTLKRLARMTGPIRTKDLPQRDRMPVPAVKGSFKNPYSTGRALHTMHERRLIDWENEDASRSPDTSCVEPRDAQDLSEPSKVHSPSPAADAAPGSVEDLAVPDAGPSSSLIAADISTNSRHDGLETLPPPSTPNYHPVPDDGSVPAVDGPQTPQAQLGPRIHFAIGEVSQTIFAKSSPFRDNLRVITGLIRKGLGFVLAAAGVWLATMFMLIVVFGFLNPPLSALMLIRMAGGQTIDQRWVSIEGISPNLVRAVISSEDARFCSHWGIDTDEIEAAIRRARGGLPRGASTMTMQLAKNLFLWPEKSYFRKALEAPLTLMIEALWSKRRIAEVYLNVVEWGPGIFGAQAAARHHFKKPASTLSAAQAAALAVSLPNPIARQPSRHGPRLRAMSRTVQARMRAMGGGANCVLGR